MAATADSLQQQVRILFSYSSRIHAQLSCFCRNANMQVDEICACCPVLSPAIIPSGYETQDLVELMQNAGERLHSIELVAAFPAAGATTGARPHTCPALHLLGTHRTLLAPITRLQAGSRCRRLRSCWRGRGEA